MYLYYDCILLYVLLVGFGWMNIYASSSTDETREIFDFSKMMIIYSGKTNVNDKINKLLKQFKI